MTITIERRIDRFDQVAAALPRECSAVIRKTAFDVFARSQIEVPRLTGHLALTGSVRGNGNEWEVYYGADYAGWVHEGTRHHAPNPFVTRSLDAVLPSTLEAFAQLESRLV